MGHWSEVPLASGGTVPWVIGLFGLDSACDRLPDVFDPGFPAQARDAVQAQVERHNGDPSLIGYFRGNEPAWTWPGAPHPLQTVWAGGPPHTARAALAWVRDRYGGDIEALGRAWGRPFGSWEAVCAGPPDARTGPEGLRADGGDFGGWLLERFYAVCCGAVRELDPGRLLLGPRFHTAALPEPYLRACRAFDAISRNGYRRQPSAADLTRLEALAGRPVLLGEFSFGVRGRGLSAGIVPVRDDAERGEAYEAYVRAASAHPACIGAHWFRWVDEPVTGRFDGEDYNVGLVDVTDVPYAGLVAGARRAHRDLYRLRSGQAPG